MPFFKSSVLLFVTAVFVLIGCDSGIPVASNNSRTAPILSTIRSTFTIEAGANQPDSLAPIYPNPFNSNLGDTTIHVFFSLRDTAAVKLLIQNALGDSVVLYTDSILAPGSYVQNWLPHNRQGELLREGIYFITLRVIERDFIESKLFFIEAD